MVKRDYERVLAEEKEEQSGTRYKHRSTYDSEELVITARQVLTVDMVADL